jgi:ABC-type uncharacterized transport system YnjBCD ATPase subunit
MELLHIGFSANGLREIRTFIFEFEGETHSFSGNENIGKDDDGVDVEATEGLDGDFERQIGILANFQKRMLCANYAVFGEIAASLAHHPDGKARNGLATAGTEEELLAGNGAGLGGHVKDRG